MKAYFVDDCDSGNVQGPFKTKAAALAYAHSECFTNGDDSEVYVYEASIKSTRLRQEMIAVETKGRIYWYK